MRVPTTRDAVGLMVAIITGSTPLPGAACQGRHQLFDTDVRGADLGYGSEAERWSAVQATCQSCPVRGQCWAWASKAYGGQVVGPTAASQVNPFNMRRTADHNNTQQSTNTRRPA